jgi:hypothetical protein
MSSIRIVTLFTTRRCFAAAVAAAMSIVSCAVAQNQLVEPVYRVANEAAAVQPSAAASAVTAEAVPQTSAPGRVVLDFTQQPGEHPLAPVIRVCKASLEEMDRNLHDYSCTFVKQERIDGELGEPQHIFLKVRHEPFSVYMSFLKPYQGREVLYVAGQNNGEMVVREAGFKRVLGKMNLDPQGAVAMRGQKYPITRVGIYNLTAQLLRNLEAESKYGECEVVHNANPKIKISGRPATMVQVTHPVRRQNYFRAHIARLFFDNELGIPIHYDAYLWPQQPGERPPLDESFTYTNLKINNGYTARDFDANNNPEIFKP